MFGFIKDRLSIVYIGALIGSGLKLGPVPIVDEIALIINAAVNRRSLFTIKIDIFSLMVFWLLMLSVVGVASGNLNNIRFIIISFFLLFLSRGGKYHANYNIKYIVLCAWLLLLVYLSIIVLGLGASYKVAWWQDYLWTGTAYTAFGLYVSSVILFVYYRNIFIILFVLLVMLFLSVLTDSRIGMIMSLFYLGAFLIYKPYKMSFSERVQKYGSFGLLIIVVMSLMGSQLNIIDKLDSVYMTLSDMLIDSNVSRDTERKEHLNVVYQLAADDPFHFIVGHGVLSHQFDLAAYLPTSPDGSGRVRPTGLPAIIFDGGIILLILIIMNAIWVAVKLITIYIKNKTPLYIIVLCLSIPFFAILSIPITNSMDMVLWWLALAPGGISFLLLSNYHNRVNNKNMVLRY